MSEVPSQQQKEVGKVNEIGTSEAVRLYRMHPATVLRLILTEQVVARKDANGRWLIRRGDLDIWAARRKQRLLRTKQRRKSEARRAQPPLAEIHDLTRERQGAVTV